MANAGPIDEHVASMRRALRGPRGARRDLLAEARDSLLDAAEVYESEGLPRAEAERLAVSDFGTVSEIAPGFQAELAVSQGRRTAGLLFLSVPLTAFLWAVIWRVFPETPRIEQVKPDWFGLLARTVDLIQLGVGVVGGLALLALGRGSRRFRRPALLTRWLGVFVWVQTPLVGAMGLALAAAAQGPVGFTGYLPGLAVALFSYVLSAAQLYHATRCLRCTMAVPALSAADRGPSLSRS
ncbi:permease prefix domain 1-containing protein [Microbispora sp. H11081]|uniref:permease prefix domain 1-containing protein n=1 Tax=Microbispora sp. H11081 TaxID=2729107 RepID=UPI001B8C8251|nr:permease prefix domain 1-containing protein [Microbispora sp. H11081]